MRVYSESTSANHLYSIWWLLRAWFGEPYGRKTCHVKLIFRWISTWHSAVGIQGNELWRWDKVGQTGRSAPHSGCGFLAAHGVKVPVPSRSECSPRAWDQRRNSLRSSPHATYDRPALWEGKTETQPRFPPHNPSIHQGHTQKVIIWIFKNAHQAFHGSPAPLTCSGLKWYSLNKLFLFYCFPQ